MAATTVAGVGGVLALLTALGLGGLLQFGLPWEPEAIYELPRNTTWLPEQADINESDYSRRTVTFTSQGVNLEGWLYEPQPQPSSPPPCVIMAHGLGAQKDMGLHIYAEQFAQAGMAVLAFDYRGFGGSDGAVRNLVSWPRHLQDWQAALDFVHSGGLGKGRVDTTKVGLWGVSFSGGHVLMTASKEENAEKIRAVVANAPFLSNSGNVEKALGERGIKKVLRLLSLALLDKAREVTGVGSPVYVKLVGSYEELAVLNMHPDELALSRGPSTRPPQRIGGWKNICTARMLLDMMFYKPLAHVHKVTAPTLIVAGNKDVVTPIAHIREAIKTMSNRTQLLEKPYGHMEQHRYGATPQELAPVIDFLREQFALSPRHVETHPHEPVPEAADAEVM
ncbi:Alpha/Beta hydrolase protein [Haematococcus lacustris]